VKIQFLAARVFVGAEEILRARRLGAGLGSELPAKSQTYAYFPPAYCYMGRVREGTGFDRASKWIMGLKSQ
jgi:hypothetical protein